MNWKKGSWRLRVCARGYCDGRASPQRTGEQIIVFYLKQHTHIQGHQLALYNKKFHCRLCQAEISKRTAHILHSVILVQGRMSQTDVTGIVSKLPLPEDYLMEELRHINEAFAQT